MASVIVFAIGTATLFLLVGVMAWYFITVSNAQHKDWEEYERELGEEIE